MKRKYIKPEARPICLRLSVFITAGSNGVQEYMGDDPLNPGGENNDPDNNSRSWGYSMWDNME